MEAGSLRRLSLDTNILFDLADEKDFAHDFRETYQAKAYALVICPTVVAELYFFHEYGRAEERRLASITLGRVASWDIQAFALTGVQLDIAWKFANSILSRNLLPECEINDARILGESSVAGIALVVSSDRHLVDMDQDVLRAAFAEADLPPSFPNEPTTFAAGSSVTGLLTGLDFQVMGASKRSYRRAGFARFRIEAGLRRQPIARRF